MKYVRKRDGKLAKFDSNRITKAIWKAAKAVGGKNKAISERLSEQVVTKLEKRFGDEGVPTVEEIQDLVEKTLKSRVISTQIYGGPQHCYQIVKKRSEKWKGVLTE